MTKKILITGGCGFIGAHFVEHFLKNTDWDVFVIDNLTYASAGFDRLRDINVFDDKRVRIFTSDITRKFEPGMVKELDDVTYVLHLAASTHVDRSIADPEPTIMTNFVGTFHMLELAKVMPALELFLYFSTDEVFGPAPFGYDFKPDDRYHSTNPYSASKAGGEELTLAWFYTYKVPIIITHTMNIFGERQAPEKFLPKIIYKVLKGEKITIHTDKNTGNPGSRYWLHARNSAAAIHFLLDNYKLGEKYNVVGQKEIDNLAFAKIVADVVGKPLDYELIDGNLLRPGHDVRYALDGAKLQKLGFRFPINFEKSLEKAVKWYLDNPKWIFEWRNL